MLHLSIRDALGKVIWSKQEWNGAAMDFDLKDLAKGVYFLKIDDGQNIRIKRIVKN